MSSSFVPGARFICGYYTSLLANESKLSYAAGLHWPSDIAGGALIGIAVGLLTHWVAEKYLNPKPAA